MNIFGYLDRRLPRRVTVTSGTSKQFECIELHVQSSFLWGHRKGRGDTVSTSRSVDCVPCRAQPRWRQRRTAAAGGGATGCRSESPAHWQRRRWRPRVWSGCRRLPCVAHRAEARPAHKHWAQALEAGHTLGLSSSCTPRSMPNNGGGGPPSASPPTQSTQSGRRGWGRRRSLNSGETRRIAGR